MEHDSAERFINITGIYINLVDPAIETEDRYGTVARIAIGGETILFTGVPRPPTAQPMSVPEPVPPPPDYIGPGIPH